MQVQVDTWSIRFRIVLPGEDESLLRRGYRRVGVPQLPRPRKVIFSEEKFSPVASLIKLPVGSPLENKSSTKVM